MQSKNVFSTTWKTRVLLSLTLFFFVFVGCNAITQIAATPTAWVFCAKENSGCGFSGLRDVRFVQDGKETIKSFYGGLDYCKEYNCPSSHPVPIPEITFNVRFPIPQNVQGWHLASDMYDYASQGGGFSAHADWWDGWDTATEKTWIETCDIASKDCHAYLLGNGTTLY